MSFVKRHGLTDTPTHISWVNMNHRCGNSNATQYRYYGGKGISICERWKSFEAFLADMGERPDGTTLDRIDNSKDYSPDNCVWSSRKQQSRNRSMNIQLSFNGKTQIVSEWSAETYIPYKTLLNRIHKGWSAQKALTQPVRGHARTIAQLDKEGFFDEKR